MFTLPRRSFIRQRYSKDGYHEMDALVKFVKVRSEIMKTERDQLRTEQQYINRGSPTFLDTSIKSSNVDKKINKEKV